MKKVKAAAPVDLYRERPPYLVKSAVGLAEMVVEANPLPEAQMALISDAGLQVGEFMFHVRFITKEGGTVGVELSVAQDKGPDLMAVALSRRDGAGTVRLQVWEPHVEGGVWLPVETVFKV